jgi:hypothetical protein
MSWFGSGKKTGVCETCKKKFSASESYMKTYGQSCIECRITSSAAERAKIQREQAVERVKIQIEQAAEEAYMNEEDLDYAGALKIWESLGDRKEAKRIRKKMREEGKVKVDQTVVHGDYVDDRDTTYIDDRDTIVKDSVINRSNVGADGDNKAEKLREAKALLDDGIIDDDEFKQMKKEILGK